MGKTPSIFLYIYIMAIWYIRHSVTLILASYYICQPVPKGSGPSYSCPSGLIN
jgi:hypothetical protein